MIELLWWEYVLRQFAVGCLFVGFIFFFFSLITSVLGQVDHDHELVSGSIDHDFDIDTGLDLDIDTGLDLDIDTGLDLDVDTGLDLDVDHDVAVDHDVGITDQEISSYDSSPAPLMLLISTFFLSFGVFGFSFYEIEMNSILRLVLLLLLPIAIVKIISLFWRRYLISEEVYEIPKVKIDNQVKTLTRVDEKGGMVLADTGDVDRVGKQLHLLGHIKMIARTKSGVIIEKDEIGYVIGIEKGHTLIVDRWPNPVNKT